MPTSVGSLLGHCSRLFSILGLAGLLAAVACIVNVFEAVQLEWMPGNAESSHTSFQRASLPSPALLPSAKRRVLALRPIYATGPLQHSLLTASGLQQQAKAPPKSAPTLSLRPLSCLALILSGKVTKTNTTLAGDS